MSEYWRQSPFAGLQISDQGRLRDPGTGAIVKVNAYETKPGGPSYKRFRKRYVHEMVLTTFDRPPQPGEQCRHLNGNSLDNRLENLQWGTGSDDNYDRIRHGTHQHASKTHCKYGHPLDGLYLRPDGTVKQRICMTCRRQHSREMKAKAREARTTCPQGHPFDGVRYNADGTVRQRYCTTCVNEQLAQGRAGRRKSGCPKGHPLDGVWGSGARYCKTCHRERTRDYKARKRAGEPMRAPGRPRKTT